MLPSTFSSHVTSDKQIRQELLFGKDERKFNTNSLSDIWDYVAAIKVNDYKPCNNTRSKNNNRKSPESSTSATFCLTKIPVDLTRQIALFLCEDTIIQFERCCRGLYQLSNTTLFISQSNNFKVLSMQDGSESCLEYVSNHPYDFFKYCKSKQLTITDRKNDDSIETYRDYFGKIVDKNWFIMCLKSIEKLWLGLSGSYLLDLFPMSYLFNSQKNPPIQYFRLHFDNIASFKFFPVAIETQTVNIANKNVNSKSMIVNAFDLGFNYVKDDEYCMGKYDDEKFVDNLIKQFNIKHLTLGQLNIKMEYFQNIEKYHSNLTALTLQSDVFVNDIKSYCHNCNYKKGTKALKLNINTLRLPFIQRLTDIDDNSIIGNQNARELLNLDRTVKNLTLSFALLDYVDSSTICCQLINKIIKKEYFYNLVNVNILVSEWLDCDTFDVDYDDEISRNFFCGQFFDILISNKTIIKEQFKQFNVGYEIVADFDGENCWDPEKIHQKVYDTFSYNDKMTDNEIKMHKDIWNMMAQDFFEETINGTLQIDYWEESQKYHKMKYQRQQCDHDCEDDVFSCQCFC